MIHHVQGNLLESHEDYVTHCGHQSNCIMGFGSGIAGQIRQILPGAYKSFVGDSRPSYDKLGTYSVARENVGEFEAVYNLYGQYNVAKYPGEVCTQVPFLRKALVAMIEDIKANPPSDGYFKIALPWLIGCGLAGGDWNEVYAMIDEVSDALEVDITFYEYTP